jgi:hypothetical protein
MPKAKSQSYWWYIPILIVLSIGYLVGGWLVFGVHFLNAFPQLTDDSARFILELLGMGMLGSTIYCSKWWAKDIEEAIKKAEFLPHVLDFFGYATTIMWGGITGIVLYLAVRSGSFLTITNPEDAEMRLSFALFIAFCGGLFHFKVRDWFETAIEKMLKKER